MEPGSVGRKEQERTREISTVPYVVSGDRWTIWISRKSWGKIKIKEPLQLLAIKPMQPSFHWSGVSTFFPFFLYHLEFWPMFTDGSVFSKRFSTNCNAFIWIENEAKRNWSFLPTFPFVSWRSAAQKSTRRGLIEVSRGICTTLWNQNRILGGPFPDVFMSQLAVLLKRWNSH